MRIILTKSLLKWKKGGSGTWWHNIHKTHSSSLLYNPTTTFYWDIIVRYLDYHIQPSKIIISNMTNEPMIQIENKSDVWRISSSTVSENVAFLGLERQLLHNPAPAAGHSPTNALINLTSRKWTWDNFHNDYQMCDNNRKSSQFCSNCSMEPIARSPQICSFASTVIAEIENPLLDKEAENKGWI